MLILLVIFSKKRLSAHLFIRTVLRNSLEQPISLMVKKPLQLLLLRSSELWMALSFLN